jgi:hypothetical protein
MKSLKTECELHLCISMIGVIASKTGGILLPRTFAICPAETEGYVQAEREFSPRAPDFGAVETAFRHPAFPFRL